MVWKEPEVVVSSPSCSRYSHVTLGKPVDHSALPLLHLQRGGHLLSRIVGDEVTWMRKKCCRVYNLYLYRYPYICI